MSIWNIPIGMFVSWETIVRCSSPVYECLNKRHTQSVGNLVSGTIERGAFGKLYAEPTNMDTIAAADGIEAE
jgi:hypothetical protein